MNASLTVAIAALCCSMQGVVGSVPGEINLAFRKPASQSSTMYGFFGMASNAVDGNTEGDFFKGSCTHTYERPGSHWWMVDLLGIYTIRSVTITNRDDCCDSWLGDVSIEISRDNPFNLAGFPGRSTAVDTLCVAIPQRVGKEPSFPFECDAPMTGRYVRIVIDQIWEKARLTLCEIGVYENKIIVRYPQPKLPNLALEKPARQSTTFEHATANLAVDGNINGHFFEGSSCSGTLEGGGVHWWMVDLEDNYQIDIIRIMNRYDCCAHHLAGFVIEVSDKNPSTLEEFPGRTNASVCVTVNGRVPIPVPVNYKCAEKTTGRYVRIVKNTGELSVCEFEVYGTKPNKVENGKDGQWVFSYVKSHGFQHTHVSMTEQSYLNDCARKRLKDKRNMMAAPYIQIDFPIGTCRFLENLADSKNSNSSKWTVYELIRI